MILQDDLQVTSVHIVMTLGILVSVACMSMPQPCRFLHVLVQYDVALPYSSKHCGHNMPLPLLQAVMYFRRALKLDRHYLSAWTLMGHEYVEMKNTSAAIGMDQLLCTIKALADAQECVFMLTTCLTIGACLMCNSRCPCMHSSGMAQGLVQHTHLFTH